jgi:hypothetical protein
MLWILAGSAGSAPASSASRAALFVDRKAATMLKSATKALFYPDYGRDTLVRIWKTFVTEKEGNPLYCSLVHNACINTNILHGSVQ